MTNQNRFSALARLLSETYAELPALGFKSFWAVAQEIQNLEHEELIEFILFYNEIFPRRTYGEMDANGVKAANLDKIAQMTQHEVEHPYASQR